jgi:hypothetical protein
MYEMSPKESVAVHRDERAVDLLRLPVPVRVDSSPDASPPVTRGHTLAHLMERLRLSSNLVLPLDAVTQTFAVVAPRTRGKTHPATVLVEEMVADRLPVVVVDSTGIWHGLQYSTDGKDAGLPVHVLGGQHGVLDLREHAGAFAADCAVDMGQPLVLDLSSLSMGPARSFVADFAEQICRRSARAIHLVLDEADALVWDDAGLASGPVMELVRSAGTGGIGVTLVSQRAAMLRRDVLARFEVLIAARMREPADHDRIQAWIECRAGIQEGRRVSESLESLDADEAWVCSPRWLGVLEPIRFRPRATCAGLPDPATGLRPPKSRAAAVELGRLHARLGGAAGHAAWPRGADAMQRETARDKVQTAPVRASRVAGEACVADNLTAPAARLRERKPASVGASRPPRSNSQARTLREVREKPRRGRPVERLVVGFEEKLTLQRYARQAHISPALAMRARIVLECAEGRLNGDVARDLGVTIQTVGRWRRRFVEYRLDGLNTESGSVPRFSRREGAPSISDGA